MQEQGNLGNTNSLWSGLQKQNVMALSSVPKLMEENRKQYKKEQILKWQIFLLHCIHY